jgi:hypothetical protein
MPSLTGDDYNDDDADNLDDDEDEDDVIMINDWHDGDE